MPPSDVYDAGPSADHNPLRSDGGQATDTRVTTQQITDNAARQEGLPDPARAALEVLIALAHRFAGRGFALAGVFGGSGVTIVPQTARVDEHSPHPELVTVTRFSLPLTLNDGRPVLAGVLCEILEPIVLLHGGAMLRGAHGLCIDGRRVEIDVHLDVEVWTADVDALERQVADAASLLGQREIVLRVALDSIRRIRASASQRSAGDAE